MSAKEKYYILSKEVENSETDAMLTGDSQYLWQFQDDFSQSEPLKLSEIRTPIMFDADVDNLRGNMTDNLFLIQVEGLVLTEKAKDILLQVSENIQCLPFVVTDDYHNNEEVMMAELKGKDIKYEKKVYQDYYLINIFGLIDCVDHSASKLEYFMPKKEIPDDMPEEMKKALQEKDVDNDIDFIRKLVFDETKIPEDIHIFRLKDCPRILVFKESIVQAIREAKLTGFVFVPLSEYTDEIPDDDDDEKEEEAVENKKPQAIPAKEKVEPTKKKGIIIKKIKRQQL